MFLSPFGPTNIEGVHLILEHETSTPEKEGNVKPQILRETSDE